MRHNITTSRIDLTGADTAKAKSYFVVFTEVGPDHAGHYLDQWRKVGGDWLIEHRNVVVDWKSPDSRFSAPK